MPKKRIPPSERISNEIMDLIANLDGSGSNQQILGKLMQLSMRKLVQELLEKEVKEHIGAEHYEHNGARDGYRNGYKQAHIKTTEAKLNIDRPQVADSAIPFSSDIWHHIKGNTEQLERIAVEMYARGCSTEDIEKLLMDKDGRLLLSKSAISQLNDRLWQEYETFCKTDLSEYDIVYIFCDAVYESLRLHRSPKEGILVVWGILSSGTKVLLAMLLGNKESYDDWLYVFRDLHKRGLSDPVLGTSDGAPGLIKAFTEAFPKTLRQRCLVHKKRNILGKVPQDAASEVKFNLNSVYFAADEKAARTQAEYFKEKFGRLYPSAVQCFEDDFDACIQHLKCPAHHIRFISSTNLAERSFGEQKRRSKVIPRFFDEKSGLKLVFASLIRASQGWRKISFTFDDQIRIMELRHKLGHKAKKERKISKNLKRTKILVPNNALEPRSLSQAYKTINTFEHDSQTPKVPHKKFSSKIRT
jgi:transposase-like protein